MTEYTISELSENAGINRRNIHFYVQQGLLPPPEGAGLAARYTDEHLLRLKAIPVLRRQGLRLDEIRARLASLDANGLKRLLTHAPPMPPVREIPPPGPPIRCPQTVNRYTLAPGVELLVDADAEARIQPALEELLRDARRLFNQPRR